ncbi:hypothetical protein Smp_151270 [Schistosoma mansoni]|uniref:Uncharacterized protein n=1 Tax=Schistosoma mansoni TaxID=6183 RepID=G4VQJ0_SCHMA|nr:hypothetical protein Smp_151270 [Schistosoma mansoni]|eukprot:XP_018655135.1 hypothetical protein Smp_151270 [Schistosoma mansoni]
MLLLSAHLQGFLNHQESPADLQVAVRRSLARLGSVLQTGDTVVQSSSHPNKSKAVVASALVYSLTRTLVQSHEAAISIYAFDSFIIRSQACSENQKFIPRIFLYGDSYISNHINVIQFKSVNSTVYNNVSVEFKITYSLNQIDQ